jgi:hypothetical protein
MADSKLSKLRRLIRSYWIFIVGSLAYAHIGKSDLSAADQAKAATLP